MTEDGGEVQLLAEGAEAGTATGTAAAAEPSAHDHEEGENCHFHAGVEYASSFLSRCSVLTHLQTLHRSWRI
jgi:hypothetical protein